MCRRLMFIGLLTALEAGCTKEIGSDPGIGGYPPGVDEILRGTCATQGCHNSRSKEAAAGLDLSRWDQMIAGGRNGPAVIPYRPDYSVLCFYTNTFNDLGPSLKPTMPLNRSPLIREQVQALQSWIAAGAPSYQGKIAGEELQPAHKLYVANRLCDVVTVLDAETGMPSRFIDVGAAEKTEFPFELHMARGGKRWLVTFLAGGKVQVFDAATDKAEGFIDPGPGQWLSAAISGDGKRCFLADRSAKGRIVVADLESRKIINVLTDSAMYYPRSLFLNEVTKKLYVGSESGNYITAIDYTTEPATCVKVSLDGQPPHSLQGTSDPWLLSGDDISGRLWTGCVSSGKLIEIDMATNNISYVFDLGVIPTAIAYSRTWNRLFVSAMNDSVSFPGHEGSVTVVDLSARAVTRRIRAGYQSAGIWIAPGRNVLTVVNSNISEGGPAPHHKTGCAGRNGYLSFIDLRSLETTPQRYELAVFPWAITGPW